MNNNDILKRLRYALDLNDRNALALFSLDPKNRVILGPKHYHAMLAKEDDSKFEPCTDQRLSAFLDGLIVKKRGLKKPSSDTPTPQPSETNEPLSRNLILKKLRIAFAFTDDDILKLTQQGGSKNLSKPQINAFFRNPNHKNYKPCGEQILRNFLKGLSNQLRPKND
jgi:uncharacterized protein YehS (DUF1456 family)